MQRPSRGFTLIEQIVAIAVAGVATAAALPALADLRAQADATTLQHLASAAGSAMAINQGGCLVSQQAARPGVCQPVADCVDVTRLLQADLPAGIVVVPQALPAVAPGVEAHCQLQDRQRGTRAGFRAYPTGG